MKDNKKSNYYLFVFTFRFKLTISVSSLKMNLSDRKIGMVLDFMDNLPLPSPNTLRVSEADLAHDKDITEDQNLNNSFVNDIIKQEPSSKELLRVKRLVVFAEITKMRRVPDQFDKAAAKMAMLEVDK